jgi:hypothetical protein
LRFLEHTCGPTLSEMTRVFQLLVYAALALRSNALTYGPSSYAPPGAFPTSLYNSYYNNPTATSAQPQPVISDPVLVRVYATFCEALLVLTRIHRTRCILLGLPTRTIYPRCVIFRSASLDAPRLSSLFSRRMTPRTPTLSHHVPPTNSSYKPP